MNRLAWTIVVAMLMTSIAFAQGQEATRTTLQGKFATDLDRQVLEALLISALQDPEFPPPIKEEKPKIVLHRRTPKMISSVINTAQVMYETNGKVMPKEAWDDLVRRNEVRLDPNAREVHYEGLGFDPRIVVGNAFPGPEAPFVGKTFEEVFPDARGWIEAFVPGYSKDRKTAIIRARIGPTEKTAMLTAILKQVSGKWVVEWRQYSVYN